MSKLPVPKSREEMEDLVRDICVQQVRCDGIKNEMKSALLYIGEQYEDQITANELRLKAMMKCAKKWADKNIGVNASSRSIIMVAGTVGYRKGNPFLKPAKGYTWDRILGVLEAAFKKYVRVKKEPNKELLLEDWKKISDSDKKQMGIEQDQKDSFFVDGNTKEVAS